ncbi:MAG: rod shape-determining protein [Dehalococcoidia bacterium]|nr:rod shape-determining protein [Dehalococcoidia bacterium]
MASLTRELGIDLGTSFIVIAEGPEIVLQEPTTVAILLDEWKMIEWGQSAKDMFGRVPDDIEVVNPIQNGVIAEYEITENLLRYIVQKICGPMVLFRPKLMITVPCNITSVESRAVHEAGIGAGSREVYLIQQPLAAALGIDLPISPPSGNMVISLGGGTNQVAVMAMNSIISSGLDRTGGQKMDEEIINYIRKQYGVILSKTTAEVVKMRVGAAIKEEEILTLEVQGQDQISGLPRSVTISTEDLVEALQSSLEEIIKLVKRVLEATPPELVSDIMDRGVALCGGGTQLRGIDRYLTRELGIPAYLVDNPTTCTAEGAARALTMLPDLKRAIKQ